MVNGNYSLFGKRLLRMGKKSIRAQRSPRGIEALAEAVREAQLSDISPGGKPASAAFKAEQLAEEADILQNFDESLENLGPH
ncbi:MAG: hypothetical protein PVI06_20700 [Desulfobacterales bacterium]|jgi:hypothetical protein